MLKIAHLKRGTNVDSLKHCMKTVSKYFFLSKYGYHGFCLIFYSSDRQNITSNSTSIIILLITRAMEYFKIFYFIWKICTFWPFTTICLKFLILEDEYMQ